MVPTASRLLPLATAVLLAAAGAARAATLTVDAPDGCVDAQTLNQEVADLVGRSLADVPDADFHLTIAPGTGGSGTSSSRPAAEAPRPTRPMRPTCESWTPRAAPSWATPPPSPLRCRSAPWPTRGRPVPRTVGHRSRRPASDRRSRRGAGRTAAPALAATVDAGRGRRYRRAPGDRRGRDGRRRHCATLGSIGPERRLAAPARQVHDQRQRPFPAPVGRGRRLPGAGLGRLDAARLRGRRNRHVSRDRPGSGSPGHAIRAVARRARGRRCNRRARTAPSGWCWMAPPSSRWRGQTLCWTAPCGSTAPRQWRCVSARAWSWCSSLEVVNGFRPSRRPIQSADCLEARSASSCR